MLLFHILVLSVAASAAVKDAVVSQMQGVVAHLLLMHEPRIVWCRVEPRGGIRRISAAPGGPEVPHSGTSTVQVDRPGEEPFAYYYSMPTPLLQTATWLGFHVGPVLLLPTSREATTRSRRWREFRRCGAEEFEAAWAEWKRKHAG